MNIALFSDSYLPTKSGIVTVVIQLRQILEQLGHHVVIVTVGENDETEKDPCILRVPSIHSPVGDGQYIGFPRRKEVLDFLRLHKIQIIHSHTEFFVGHMAIKAGKKLNIPVIASTHTMWEDYYKYYFTMGKIVPKKVIRKIVQRVYKNFYAFINVSQKAHDYFKRSYILPGIPSAIVPNAIDSKKFNSSTVTEQMKSDLKKSLNISDKDSVVLYVGRVVQEKRLNEFLQIAAKVVTERQNTKFVIVGNGEREEPLRQQTEELGLSDRIIFTGFIDWHKLHTYYAIANVFVTVSLSEMHSMTILEALSLGVPVVCRKDTSFSDTVFPGVDGYFGNTDEEVKKYIEKVIDDHEAAGKMGEEALKISRRFTLDIHGRRTVAFYEQILKSYPKAVTDKELQAAVDQVK